MKPGQQLPFRSSALATGHFDSAPGVVTEFGSCFSEHLLFGLSQGSNEQTRLRGLPFIVGRGRVSCCRWSPRISHSPKLVVKGKPRTWRQKGAQLYLFLFPSTSESITHKEGWKEKHRIENSSLWNLGKLGFHSNRNEGYCQNYQWPVMIRLQGGTGKVISAKLSQLIRSMKRNNSF